MMYYDILNDILEGKTKTGQIMLADRDARWDKFPDAGIIIAVDRGAAEKLLELAENLPKGVEEIRLDGDNMKNGLYVLAGYDMQSGIDEKFSDYDAKECEKIIERIKEESDMKDPDNSPWLEHNTYCSVTPFAISFGAWTESGECSVAFGLQDFCEKMRKVFDENAAPCMQVG